MAYDLMLNIIYTYISSNNYNEFELFKMIKIWIKSKIHKYFKVKVKVKVKGK